MSDYISREAAIEKIREAGCTDCGGSSGTICGFCDFENAIRLIKRLPAADVEPVRHWIPCSESLPHDVSRCLVCRYDYVTKTRFIDILWFEHGIWWNRSHGGDYAVTHWMPLPELPEEEQ